MNRLLITLIISAGIFSPTFTRAQSETSGQSSQNAVERIMVESMGNVNIDIPDNILHEILKEEKVQPRRGHQDLRPGINKIDGYRIQVFSDGQQQHSLESRARSRGNVIVSKFPKYRGQVYSYSSAPNWYTRVGNFRTSAEASSALAELKRAFPQFASEMRIVKTKIVVIR